MVTDSALSSHPRISLPDIPALVVGAHHACVLTTEGELKTLPHAQAQMIIHEQAALVCHAPYTHRKLDSNRFQAFDVLELFAFVHPASFAVPTVFGLCKTLGLRMPQDMEDQATMLVEITKALLSDLQKDPLKAKADPLEIAKVMGLNGKGWVWAPFVCEALGETYDPVAAINGKTAMNIWKALPEWAEEAPPPPPSHHGVSPVEAEERLDRLLGDGAEERLPQKEFAVQIAGAFQPSAPAEPHEEERPPPHIILAEAGTGVGKTLGYLAPASVWAEKNQGTVWISTFTKNLQRQIDQELDKLYPNTELKDTHTAVRKGRENYLCLLNLEDAVNGAALARTPKHAVAAGIMARWAAATKDGDLTGAEFPGWISGLLGYAYTQGLADRRGECIYSACDHYHRCFVERSIRKAERARIVVANHALSMISAALAGPEERMPSRYIFDEGHHLFHAADSAFAAHLTARETQDLRRWILGAEGGRRSRARGLKRRAEDLCAGDDKAERALRGIVSAAECLTAYGWEKRLKDNMPSGPCEKFIMALYAQISARTRHQHTSYSVETESFPVDEPIAEAAAALIKDLKALQKPMLALARVFAEKLAQDNGEMAADTRKRLDAVAASLERRARTMIAPWIEMLTTLQGDTAQSDTVYIDWMEIERIDGRTIDIGMYRHYIDPMQPFAAAMKPHVQGMAITSATLRDQSESWEAARISTGAGYLSPTPIETAFDSPFDYASNTKVLILNDVNKNDLRQVAGAYRALFDASGGGALGLFTAINRLRAVHNEIAEPLEEKGLKIYSQHVDDIDAGTLVDMFREDEHACLLGTDAVRDGVDVPGHSLRLIAFDRTPWPRPTILHKARRAAFGGRQYDEMITRLKLKQAFGRLVRRASDKGVFVMLDSALPSRLHNAFPVTPEKVSLKEAVEMIKSFL